ncbi:LLM class flavin-dependent oxidoreductase [Actinocorallia sp. A-T 12471]|uniref:LLM class flavin-dependent oxidoreductase n=1 Tax=Actinocorallia sp. A-T 12471 TaxID=3089813 RepID=UPI0029D054C4|nr:LLM class flavin-dependent oxidoreductase [Actinocorallia sp. A-T 12471]MDX6741103.1 LLM class flavin-dependent oxidoreductase [Actinocorallia sp. A-T 12471]
MSVPLSILDLAPIPSGGTARDALRNTLDLARNAEAFGYRRYWLAEHHLAPGVASSAPQVLIGAVAAATRRIRVGSGAVQVGHWTSLAVAEQFGTLDALYPDRIDLGIGRSGQRRAEIAAQRAAPPPPRPEPRTVDGLLIPRPFDFSVLAGSDLLKLHALLQQPGAQTPDFSDTLDEITSYFAGTHRTPDGIRARSFPGEGADPELWILGSSGGESARVAGERGLPFAANYHVAPSHVLEAVEAYRAAFKPSDVLAEPHVMVSADVVVAEDDDAARRLAAPYALWVRSIRRDGAAIPFPTEAEAAAHRWSDADRELVADRTETQFVGAPETVVERLRTLQRVTDADELLVTTIVHDHAARVSSFELLARAWHGTGENR